MQLKTKYRVFSRELVNAKDDDELIAQIMKLAGETDRDQYMRRFEKRAQMLDENIDGSSLRNFIKSLMVYGYIVKLESEQKKCA